jgi:oligoribonuclease NrnB/cAMP/cGMP phosphodiesterase (DHH superfamily)
MNGLHFDVIIYHTQCSDGITCAWIAKKVEPSATYLSYKAGCIPHCDFRNKNILFMDISPDYETLIEYIHYNLFVVIIDHHKTTLEIIKSFGILKPQNLKLYIDMEKAGCQLVWEYFFKEKEKPWFIDYIADRDLWTWKLENSKEINASLFYDGEISLNKLDDLSIGKDKKIEQLIKRGKLILDIKNKEIQKYKKDALEAIFKTPFNTYRIWLSNCPYSLRSDVGSILAYTQFSDGALPAFSATWVYNPQTDEWYISLRGSDISPDLTEICKCFGGGGHPKASGFTIPPGSHLRNLFIIT